MSEWSTGTVEDYLDRLSLGSLPTLQTTEYKPTGRYPVIDQGRNLIAAWTDDDRGLISSGLPVVVFGDHTRSLKYIDFPFVRGADGTQILKPKVGIDPLFFYYACRALDLPSRGYNRHFKALKEMKISFPSGEVQRTISLVLKMVDDAVSLQEAEHRISDTLKKATLTALFTRGLAGQVPKETEIGPVPKNWSVSTLGQAAVLERGRFLHRPRNEPRFYGGETPFVQTGDVVRSNGQIREFSQTLNEDGVAISRVFPAGTILITIAANIGFTGILQFDSACPDSLVAITPREKLIPEFLEYWLQTQQAEMDRLAPKGTQKNINIQFLTAWPVVIPPVEEQKEIVATINALDRKANLHRQKHTLLERLFQFLLHKLIMGELSVAQLDLSSCKTDGDVKAAA